MPHIGAAPRAEQSSVRSRLEGTEDQSLAGFDGGRTVGVFTTHPTPLQKNSTPVSPS
jgi:hypothetical protein